MTAPGTLSAIAALAMLAMVPLGAARGDTPTDACSLLTPAQVSAALGSQVLPGNGIVSHICSWYEPGVPTAAPAKGVTLILYPLKKFQYFKDAAAGYGSSKTSLRGVGDEAAFGTIHGFASTLLVRKGDIVFLVRMEGFPFEKNGTAPRRVEKMEKIIAEAVLAKL
jgi:hypothetical protein